MLQKVRQHRLIVGTIVFLMLLVAIPVTVNFLSQQQETRSRASGETVAVILDPQTKNINVGDTIDIQVNINGGQSNITAVDITFSYDTARLEQGPPNLEPGFTPSSTFTLIQGSGGNGTIRYIGVNPSATPITGTFNIGTLHFRAKAAGSATVGFSNIHINAAGISGALPVDTTNTKPGTYTIGTGAPITDACTCDGIDYDVLTSGQNTLITAYSKVTGENVSLAEVKGHQFALYEGSDTIAVRLMQSNSPANIISNTDASVRYKSVWNFQLPTLKPNTTYRIASKVNCVAKNSALNFTPSNILKVNKADALEIPGTSVEMLQKTCSFIKFKTTTNALPSDKKLLDFNDDGMIDEIDLNLMLASFKSRTGD